MQVTGEGLEWLQRVWGSAESDGCCAQSFELSGTSVTTQAAGGGQGNVGSCLQVGVTKNTGSGWAVPVPSLLDFLVLAQRRVCSLAHSTAGHLTSCLGLTQ